MDSMDSKLKAPNLCPSQANANREVVTSPLFKLYQTNRPSKFGLPKGSTNSNDREETRFGICLRRRPVQATARCFRFLGFGGNGDLRDADCVPITTDLALVLRFGDPSLLYPWPLLKEPAEIPSSISAMRSLSPFESQLIDSAQFSN